MMKSLLSSKWLQLLSVVCLNLLLPVLCTAQAGWQWGRYVVNDGGGETFLCKTDRQNNVYIGGNFEGDSIVFGSTTFHRYSHSSSAPSTIGIAKYSSAGNFRWASCSTNGEAAVLDIITDASSNMYLFGLLRTDSISFGSHTIVNPHLSARCGTGPYFIVKYDSTGNIMWSNVGGEIINNGGWPNVAKAGIACDVSGNIYIAGLFRCDTLHVGSVNLLNATHDSINIFVAKLNTAGSTVWAENFLVGREDNLYGINVSHDNKIYITGEFASGHIVFGSTTLTRRGGTTGYSTPVNAYLVKLDTSGTVVWAKNPNGGVHPFVVVTDSANNIYIGGQISDTNFVAFGLDTLRDHNLDFGAFLAKYDTSGSVLWARGVYVSSYTTYWANSVYGLAVDPCNNIWMSGPMDGDTAGIHFGSAAVLRPDTPNYDPIFVAGYNSMGTFLQATSLPTGGDDKSGLSADDSGNIYVCSDIWLEHDFVMGHDTIRVNPHTENPLFGKYFTNLYHPTHITGALVSITATPGDTVCTMTPVTYSATVTGGGSFVYYQWKVNGVIAGSTSSVLTITPSSGDSVQCFITTMNTCSGPAYAGSNVIHMVINAFITPSINISPIPNDTVCTGTSVTYTATITGGGSSPAYQWKVNGSNVGSGTGSYTYTPANGDSVRCVLTSNAPCITSAVVSSNMIDMVVDPIVIPAIAISASPRDTICIGETVTFSASVSGGGTSPTFQWYVNGSVVSSGGTTYSYSPANGDSIRCVMTSNAPCASPATVSSNTINMIVAFLAHPGITLSGPVVTPVGNPVTITAVVAGAGSSYVIHWMDYGTVLGTTTVPSFTYTKTMATDSITARVVSNDFCYDSTASAAHMVYDHDVSVGNLQSAVSSLHVYPNPVNSFLHVNCETVMQSFVITNVLGQVVVKSECGERSAVVPFMHLPAGVYLLEVIGEDGGIYRKRIVRG